MEKKNNPLKNMQLQVRPSPPVLKVMLMVVILLSMATLGTLRLVHNGIQEEIQNLKDEAASLEYANEELDRKTQDQDSIENVQEIAQEDLGMVEPGTILFDVQ